MVALAVASFSVKITLRKMETSLVLFAELKSHCVLKISEISYVIWKPKKWICNISLCLGLRDIKALCIKCDNVDRGCDWIGTVAYLEEHLNFCDYRISSNTPRPRIERY